MRALALICTFTAAVSLSAQSYAQPTNEADAAGERLSRVTEDYNEARLKRASLDAKLAAARDNLDRSASRLQVQRSRLGEAVRDLYMHPAAGLHAFFAAKSYKELQRGSAMTGRVAMSADGLILQIRRSRAEERAAASYLERLRNEARADELEIERQRAAAAEAYRDAQAALRRANLGALEAARKARIEAAAGLAAERITFVGKVRPGAATAVRAAASQIGKPYRWGGAGPNNYDCSGLTMWSWAKAGVSLPHSSRAQYASLPHVPLSKLAPGDLVFSGSPIHHVAIYKGGGVVIHAPHSGASVREESVWALNPIGAARP